MPRARRKPAKPTVPPARVPTGMIPTPETATHGSYEIRLVEKNGAKVAVNYTENPLRTMELWGTITGQQREAGETFQALHRMVWSTGRSDILSQHVSGIIHETEAMVDRIRKANDLLRRIERRIRNPSAYLRLLDVCVDGAYIPKSNAYREARERLIEALDICADVLGVPKYREEKS